MRPNLLVLGLLAAAASCNPDHPPPRTVAPVMSMPSPPAVPNAYGLAIEALPERPAGAALAIGGEEHALVLRRAVPSPMMPAVTPPPVPAIDSLPTGTPTAQQVLAVEAAYRHWCAFADSPADRVLLASAGGVRLPGAVACARSEGSPMAPARPLLPAALRPPLGRRSRPSLARERLRTENNTTDRPSVNALQEDDFSLLRRQGRNLRNCCDLRVFWGCFGRGCTIPKLSIARFQQVVSRCKEVISPLCGFFGRRCRERFFALQEGEIIFLRRAFVTVACLAGMSASLAALATDLPSGTRFLSRGAQGWFWYERMPEPPAPPTSPEPAPPVAASPPPAAEAAGEPSPAPSPPPPLSAAWFRAELEHYRDAAIDNPTPANVRAYLYLQKVMLDKADGFARVSGEVAAADPYLDATTERPLAPFASNAASAAATSRRAAVLGELSATAGILFIVERDCGVCLRQADVLQSVQRQYGFSLLTVSLDGAGPAGLQLPVRPDAGQAVRLGVVGTPALYLMRPPDVILPLAQGALDQDTLLERIVAQAHRAGWVDDATYAATRPVRQPFVTPEPGSLNADRLADPVQLVASLRATLGLPDSAGVTP